MGDYKHHAILVTSYEQDVRIYYDKAKEIFGPLVSEIVQSPLNGYQSFFIAPDGGCEWYEDSDIWDGKRAKYMQFLNLNDMCNSSRGRFTFVELFYGSENGESKILNHN